MLKRSSYRSLARFAEGRSDSGQSMGQYESTYGELGLAHLPSPVPIVAPVYAHNM